MDKDPDLKTQTNIKITKGRYDPKKIDLDEDFSLLKFSSLKG